MFRCLVPFVAFSFVFVVPLVPIQAKISSTILNKSPQIAITDGRSSVRARSFKDGVFRFVQTETRTRGGTLKTTYILKRHPLRYRVLAQRFIPFERLHLSAELFQEPCPYPLHPPQTPTFQEIANAPPTYYAGIGSCLVNVDVYSLDIASSLQDVYRFLGRKNAGYAWTMRTDSAGANSAYQCMATRLDPIVAVRFGLGLQRISDGGREPVVDCSISTSGSISDYDEKSDKIILHRRLNYSAGDRNSALTSALEHELLHRAGIRDEETLRNVQTCCFSSSPGSSCANIHAARAPDLQADLLALSDDALGFAVLESLADEDAAKLASITHSLAQQLRNHQPNFANFVDGQCRQLSTSEGRQRCHSAVMMSTRGDDIMRRLNAELKPLDVVEANPTLVMGALDPDALRIHVVADQAATESEGKTPELTGFKPAPVAVAYASPTASSDYVQSIASQPAAVISSAQVAATRVRDVILPPQHESQTHPSASRPSSSRAEADSAPEPRRRNSRGNSDDVIMPSLNASRAPSLLGIPIAIASSLTPVAFAKSGQPTGRTRPQSDDSTADFPGPTAAAGDSARKSARSAFGPPPDGNPAAGASSGSGLDVSSSSGITNREPASAQTGDGEYTESRALRDAMTSYTAIRPALEDPEKRDVLVRALRRANVNLELVPLQGMTIGAFEPSAQLIYNRRRPDLPPKRVPVRR